MTLENYEDYATQFGHLLFCDNGNSNLIPVSQGHRWSCNSGDSISFGPSRHTVVCRHEPASPSTLNHQQIMNNDYHHSEIHPHDLARQEQERERETFELVAFLQTIIRWVCVLFIGGIALLIWLHTDFLDALSAYAAGALIIGGYLRDCRRYPSGL